jgi:hypothetical protein
MAQQLSWKTFDESVEPAPDFIACTRCGIDVNYNTVAKRQSRGNTDGRCRDCVATEEGKGGSNQRGPQICNPWRGDFDLDTMQLLNDKGEPHLPGIRKCGNADCCNRSHILSFEMLEAERHDISYRTGTRNTYAQLLTIVKKEAHA